MKLMIIIYNLKTRMKLDKKQNAWQSKI